MGTFQTTLRSISLGQRDRGASRREGLGDDILARVGLGALGSAGMPWNKTTRMLFRPIPSSYSPQNQISIP